MNGFKNDKKKFLFFVLCSLFLIAPVFAQTNQAVSAPACALSDLRYLRPEADFTPSALLPLCVYFEGTSAEQACGCRNINVLVSLLVKAANWLFGLAGAAALAVFVYGGFLMLTAAGVSERVTRGKQALLAAVIGLTIIFTAQVGLRFLLQAVLTPTAQEKKEGKPAQLEEEGLHIKFPEEK